VREVLSNVRREPRLSINARSRSIGRKRFSRNIAGKNADLRLVLPFRGIDASVISNFPRKFGLCF